MEILTSTEKCDWLNCVTLTTYDCKKIFSVPFLRLMIMEFHKLVMASEGVVLKEDVKSRLYEFHDDMIYLLE